MVLVGGCAGGLGQEEAALGLWGDDPCVAAGEEGKGPKEDTGGGTESQVGDS